MINSHKRNYYHEKKEFIALLWGVGVFRNKQDLYFYPVFFPSKDLRVLGGGWCLGFPRPVLNMLDNTIKEGKAD